MAFTNSTPNYGLPQYIGTDKPTYLGDFNGAMATIDTKIYAATTTATAAQTAASNASTLATEAKELAQSAAGATDSTVIGKQLFPVGSVQITLTGTNPSSYLGGTWVQFGKGRVLMSVSDSIPAAGTEGGNSTHTHGAGQIKAYIGPSHTATSGATNLVIVTDTTSKVYPTNSAITTVSGYNRDNQPIVSLTQNTNSGLQGTKTYGSTAESSNIQPYVTAYFWKRTA